MIGKAADIDLAPVRIRGSSDHLHAAAARGRCFEVASCNEAPPTGAAVLLAGSTVGVRVVVAKHVPQLVQDHRQQIHTTRRTASRIRREHAMRSACELDIIARGGLIPPRGPQPIRRSESNVYRLGAPRSGGLGHQPVPWAHRKTSGISRWPSRPPAVPRR